MTVTVATAPGVTEPGLPVPGLPVPGLTLTGLTVMVASPDFPSAFAATCDVPTANAVTTPAAEMLTILGSCTVQVTAASGTIAPDPS